ncbi:MAG TPA: hypothetical protein VI792_08100 [Candidatus Eisenbacteria bacterium]
MTGGAELEFRLPDLRFVPVERLLPHERQDERRMNPLKKRMREQELLKNPPVVTPLPDDGAEPRYVVLDGANRVGAAHAAGFPHIVVQVVPYEPPAVELRTWYHALGDADREHFEVGARRVPGLACHVEPAIHAGARLARREVLATVAFADGAVITFAGGRDLKERNNLLNEIVDVYRDRRAFYRMSTDSIETARARYPEVTALVVFPHFEPAEVVELATSGDRMPAGITRHLIRWRALRINVPLDRLADRSLGIEEKNRWLREWTQTKLAQRHVRFYEEPTVLFDE